MGSDGSNNWVSGIKPSLAGIPAGAQIESATLNLPPSGCLGTCAAETLTLGQATTDVSQASTGADLSNNPLGTTFSGKYADSTFDITTLVAAWTSGALPNDGIVLHGPASAAAGEKYGAASITVKYLPAAAPSAPVSLKTTPGDGGVIVGWGEPNSPGYVDATGSGDGITSYIVTAKTPSGTVAATSTTADTSALLSGLTNGVAYQITVVATNPVGNGAAATTAATPVPVAGGPAAYTQAVAQFLNARNSLQMGKDTSASGATSGDSQKSVITSWLANEASADVAVANYAASNHQQDTNDVTTLTNVLVAPDADGTSVDLFGTANETFTTVDSSSATTQSIPGQETDPVEYTFSAGSTPTITNYTDASAAVVPLTVHTDATAYSAALDGTAATPPTAVGMDATGVGFANPPAGTVRPATSYAYLAGVVSWANRNWNGSYNGYGNDCTDFVSRAMHSGGGVREVVPSFPALQTSNDSYWFQYRYWYGYRASSYSWGGAFHLAKFEAGKNAYWEPYVSWAVPGDIIFANWSGGSWTGISHAGVIAATNTRNLYIDQHSNSRYHEPLWKVAGQQTWQGSNPRLSVYITSPIS